MGRGVEVWGERTRDGDTVDRPLDVWVRNTSSLAVELSIFLFRRVHIHRVRNPERHRCRIIQTNTQFLKKYHILIRRAAVQNTGHFLCICHCFELDGHTKTELTFR